MPVQALDGRPLQVGLGKGVLDMPCLHRQMTVMAPGRYLAACCCWPRIHVL